MLLPGLSKVLWNRSQTTSCLLKHVLLNLSDVVFVEQTLQPCDIGSHLVGVLIEGGGVGGGAGVGCGDRCLRRGTGGFLLPLGAAMTGVVFSVVWWGVWFVWVLLMSLWKSARGDVRGVAEVCVCGRVYIFGRNENWIL